MSNINYDNLSVEQKVILYLAQIGKITDITAVAGALEDIDHDAYVAADVTSAIATAKSEAIAKAAEDAAAMLTSYYTTTQVDGLLSTADTAAQGYATAAQGAAESYAKTYTDALFTSFKFAQNSDIDGLFA